MDILFSNENKIYNLEFTIHKCPKIMKKDIQLVFKNDLDLDNENILIIPTWQQSSISLLDIDHDVTIEMDRLFINFKNWILPIKKKINEAHKWIDVSCPFTGKALFGNPTNFTYNELEGLTKLLNYNNDKIGCCGMVYHPRFKDRSYPITIFTNMEINELIDLL